MGAFRPVWGGGIYCLFCVPIDGWTYVKVGVSQMVFDRLLTLAPGCPFAFDTILWIGSLDRKQAFKIEKAIHRRLKAHNTSREWFRFRIDQKDHQEAFHLATRMAFSEVTGRDPTERIPWKRINEPQIRRYLRHKAKANEIVADVKDHRERVLAGLIPPDDDDDEFA